MARIMKGVSKRDGSVVPYQYTRESSISVGKHCCDQLHPVVASSQRCQLLVEIGIEEDVQNSVREHEVKNSEYKDVSFSTCLLERRANSEFWTVIDYGKCCRCLNWLCMSQSKFVFKIRAVLVRIGSIIVTEMENVPAGFILLAPLRKVEKIF
jgi:hypothetical protein